MIIRRNGTPTRILQTQVTREVAVADLIVPVCGLHELPLQMAPQVRSKMRSDYDKALATPSALCDALRLQSPLQRVKPRHSRAA